MTTWNDTITQWPEHGQQCLIWYENVVHMGFFNSNNGRFYYNGSLNLAPLQTRYWMPIPSGPQLDAPIPFTAENGDCSFMENGDLR